MEHVRGITTFIRIVETGNFSNAARDLSITPQAASIHVKQLENWVGVRLFNRNTRKVSLTEEGTQFYQTCTLAVNAIDNEVERLRNASEEAVGRVRVAAPCGIGSLFVAPAIGRFLKMNTRVEVEMLIQNRIPDVVTENIDVGILPHPLPDTSLVARRVISSPFMLCASPMYIRQHGMPQQVEDLSKHQCIDLRSWMTQTIRPWQFQMGGKIVDLERKASIVTNDAAGAIEAALSGAGIVMSSTYRAAPYIRSSRLIQILPGLLVGSLDYSLYMQRRTQIPKKTRALMEFLHQELSCHPDFQLR
ncbi:HTH-type transcriptional regulator DmlR [Bordetella tumbae]|uniref:LysR family transcriptional regulator n=1 Tax=Bordetella tumbae TaxID=1649139 RepID=UPI0039EDEB09